MSLLFDIFRNRFRWFDGRHDSFLSELSVELSTVIVDVRQRSMEFET